MSHEMEPGMRIACAVGAIVLMSQDIERHLKFLVPFLGPEEASWSEIQLRSTRIARKSLGELAGQFLHASEGDKQKLSALMDAVIKDRNEVVHHFTDRFCAQLSASSHDEILAELRRRQQKMEILHKLLREISIGLAEAMRDTVFAGTREHDEMALLCEQARASISG